MIVYTDAILSFSVSRQQFQSDASQWIILGGDWADEPHLHASVRHFYDPLALVRLYLTDQWQFHGVLYESPGIDAKTWGLDHPDNPFCFKQGLTYYKLAMEVAEDVPLAPMLLQDHFKLNLNLTGVRRSLRRPLLWLSDING